jgi:hypothetical protein
MELKLEQLWLLNYHLVQLDGLNTQMLDEELLSELEMELDLLLRFEILEVKKVHLQ